MDKIYKIIGIKGLYRYGESVNSYDLLKFVAIISMILDHIGYFFFPENCILRGFGRAAFPIFFFLIGYSKNFNISWNLLIIGLAITIFRGLLIGFWLPVDILISIFLVKMLLGLVVNSNKFTNVNLIIIFITATIWHVWLLFFFSYGALGILFAVCGYLKREENEGRYNKLFPLYIFLVLIIDYFFQNLIWGNLINFKIIFSVITLTLVYVFSSFSLVKFNNFHSEFISTLILLFSRNSLFIYWLHFVLFTYLCYFLRHYY